MLQRNLQFGEQELRAEEGHSESNSQDVLVVADYQSRVVETYEVLDRKCEDQEASLAIEGRECSTNDEASYKAKATANTKDLLIIIEQQGYACAACGIELMPDTAHLDHKTPRLSGGSDAASNLQWLCVHCNRAKGILSMGEFVAMCKRVSVWQS